MWKGETDEREERSAIEKRDNDSQCVREKEKERGEKERAVKDIVRDHCIATADSESRILRFLNCAADAKRCDVVFVDDV